MNGSFCMWGLTWWKKGSTHKYWSISHEHLVFVQIVDSCTYSFVHSKNAGLNTTQCWVNIGHNTCWIVFNQQLGCMFNPTFWEVTQPLGLNNPIAGFIHILPSAGLYLIRQSLECRCVKTCIFVNNRWEIFLNTWVSFSKLFTQF